MKIKKMNFSSQLLILLLAGLFMAFMLQIAQAQNINLPQTQVIQSDMSQRTLGQRLLENTTLNYYHQLLGPTLTGAGGETYNVFQESRSPFQSFHAANLRYQINNDWSFGVSIAAVNAYGDTITNQQTGIKSETKVRDEFFNTRFFVSIPALNLPPGTLFTTLSYEAPTSVFARTNGQQYGAVLAQSFALNIPSVKWSTGLMWQYYRMFYNQNVVPPRNGYLSLARQTTIVTAGPYLGYRLNDKWGMNSSLTFDWDQRGNQTGSRSFNNNLPDRARIGISYYPTKIKNLASVGVFTQTLIKYSADTQAIGGEFALKF
jgi:hypothetical protein